MKKSLLAAAAIAATALAAAAPTHAKFLYSPTTPADITLECIVDEVNGKLPAKARTTVEVWTNPSLAIRDHTNDLYEAVILPDAIRFFGTGVDTEIDGRIDRMTGTFSVEHTPITSKGFIAVDRNTVYETGHCYPAAPHHPLF
jgi:hypothetical protein